MACWMDLKLFGLLEYIWRALHALRGELWSGHAVLEEVYIRGANLLLGCEPLMAQQRHKLFKGLC